MPAQDSEQDQGIIPPLLMKHLQGSAYLTDEARRDALQIMARRALQNPDVAKKLGEKEYFHKALNRCTGQVRKTLSQCGRLAMMEAPPEYQTDSFERALLAQQQARAQLAHAIDIMHEDEDGALLAASTGIEELQEEFGLKPVAGPRSVYEGIRMALEERGENHSAATLRQRVSRFRSMLKKKLNRDEYERRDD